MLRLTLLLLGASSVASVLITFCFNCQFIQKEIEQQQQKPHLILVKGVAHNSKLNNISSPCGILSPWLKLTATFVAQ